MCNIFSFVFFEKIRYSKAYLFIPSAKRLLIINISLSLLISSFAFLSRSCKMHIVRDTRTSSRRRLNSDRARINGRRARAHRAVFAIRNIVCISARCIRYVQPPGPRCNFIPVIKPRRLFILRPLFRVPQPVLARRNLQ